MKEAQTKRLFKKKRGVILDAWCSKIWGSGPVAQLSRVTSDANPSRMRWRRAVQNEKLVPSRWAYIRIRGCRDGTSVPRARKRREENPPAAHDVSVCARRSYISQSETDPSTITSLAYPPRVKRACRLSSPGTNSP